MINNVNKIKILLVSEDAELLNAGKRMGVRYAYDPVTAILHIKNKWTGFDICLATPEALSKLDIVSKELEKQGKMPNEKNGTIITNENFIETIKTVQSISYEEKPIIKDASDCDKYLNRKAVFYLGNNIVYEKEDIAKYLRTKVLDTLKEKSSDEPNM